MNPDDANLIASTAPLFQGNLLAPLSASRVAAANAMGLNYFNFTKEQEKDFSERKTYDGLVYDVQIVVWLLQQNTETVVRSILNPKAAIKAVFEWVDEINMFPGSEAYSEASMLFWQIVIEAIGKVHAKQVSNDKKK